MKKFIIMALMSLVTFSAYSCSNSSLTDENRKNEMGNGLDIPVTDRKILIVYFSWGGTTQRMAEEIAVQTGGTLFRIKTVTPYPTEYTHCTEVAKKELDEGTRPALKNKVENLDQYDTIFVGCPVWWHTAPMAIVSFLEDAEYNFKDKTIIPFCTYAATYRDETLARIVELTPDSEHLTGYGTTGSVSGVQNWLQQIRILE